MVPRNWPAVENFNAALYSGAFDAARAVDALTASTALERALGSANKQLMLDHQQRIEELAHQFSGSTIDFAARAALDRRALDGVAANETNLAIADAMRATKLHFELSGATNFLESALKWKEMQQSISGLTASQHVMPWDDIKRLTDTLELEACTLHQLRRIRDFDMALRAIMPEPAGVAWSTHLRMTALPTISFLAQDWPKPFGLMTDLGRPELGASVAWLTRHRAEPMIMTAAITPQPADTKDGFELVVEDEVVCALCGSPMITFDSDVKWIGPRRGVRQRLIFPACSTCSATERQHPGFLYAALSDLTRPAPAGCVVIRGGGQGDGRPRGVLRLVRSDDKDDKR